MFNKLNRILVGDRRREYIRTFGARVIDSSQDDSDISLIQIRNKFNIEIKVDCPKDISEMDSVYVYYIYNGKEYRMFSLNVSDGTIYRESDIKYKDIKLFMDGVMLIIDNNQESKVNKLKKEKDEATYSFIDMLQRKSFWE